MYPSVVATHVAERLEMSSHGPYHPCGVCVWRVKEGRGGGERKETRRVGRRGKKEREREREREREHMKSTI